MKRTPAQPCKTSSHRRGLSPLELVLTLPLLMMAMALMVIMGAAGSWKIRTVTNSRQAVFRSMWPRTTDNDPKPQNYWPASGQLSYTSGGLTPLYNDPFADHPVVRGPVITDPDTGRSLNVKIRTLDMREGMHSGRASINHNPAMWGRLGVRNRFSRDNIIFAGQTWQYGNMGIPSNRSRRHLYTYDYSMANYNPNAMARVNAAKAALLAYPQRPALMVLDRDAELRAWYGGYIDFHPQPRGCTLDPMEYQDIVNQLLSAIDGVPRRMGNTFLRMYRDQLNQLENMNPPPPDYAQRKAELERKIKELEDFLRTLP